MADSASVPFDDDQADGQTENDGVQEAAAVIAIPNARSQAAESLLQDHRVQAFLGALRDGESGDAYNEIVGGGTFDDYSRHPRIYVPKYDSTSAGAYQFNYPTWSEQASKLGLQDFSPYSQDLAAVNLLNQLGTIPKLFSDDLDGAIFSAAQRWESLRIDNSGKSTKGNPRSIEQFKNNYYHRLY